MNVSWLYRATPWKQPSAESPLSTAAALNKSIETRELILALGARSNLFPSPFGACRPYNPGMMNRATNNASAAFPARWVAMPA